MTQQSDMCDGVTFTLCPKTCFLQFIITGKGVFEVSDSNRYICDRDRLADVALATDFDNNN